MTSFTDKDVENLKKCPKCNKYTNIIKNDKYWCWNCNNLFKKE